MEAFLWEMDDRIPSRLYGEYDQTVSPTRYIFYQDGPLDINQVRFRFKRKRAEIEKLDVVPNDARLPLAGPRVCALLKDMAPEDVQFIDSDVVCKDGASNAFKLLHVHKQIRCIDHLESKYYLVKSSTSILRFSFLRLMPDCLGGAHIARNVEYLPQIIVSKKLADRFQEMKISGVNFVLPENAVW